MTSSLTLSDSSTVCRTCLKVLDTTGFTHLDDESGYIKNVGNIREMLQFCVPELDLYVSSRPVICYQCLPILVQVYNFKIKSLSVESSIRAYIMRNNLQAYNHVNLNCVLMDDLRIKSQKIQIENRIKHLMLQETGETKQVSEPNADPQGTFEECSDNHDSIINPMDICETGTSETNEQETVERQMKIEIDESDEASLDYDPETYEEETNHDASNRITDQNLLAEEASKVAVRKDLFGNNVVNEAQPQSFILNNGMLPQNGRIVIKIDRKKLQQSISVNKPEEVESQTNATLVVRPPPLAPLHQVTTVHTPVASKDDANEAAEPQSSIEGGESPPTYNCNKCPFVTNDVIKMYDHNRTYHNFDYTCQHCPFSTSKVELLGKHMTMVHPQNMMLQKSKSFKVSENYACSLCPFSVKSIDLLRSHHMSAHGTCDVSGPIVLNKAFSNERTKHEPKILKRLEYTCDVCPYSTRDKSNLRKHLFTHGTKPLKCDHCSYKCVSPYQLRRHQKQKHAKHIDLRARSQPYKLPDLKESKSNDLDEFKITLETIKRELEKEIAT